MRLEYSETPTKIYNLGWQKIISYVFLKKIMFRVGGAEKAPDKASIEEEKKQARQNVWFCAKVFAAYVAVLRLGTEYKLNRFK